MEADGVLRDKPMAVFKNRVYAAAAGVLCYRRITTGAEGLPAAAATAAAELKGAAVPL